MLQISEASPEVTAAIIAGIVAFIGTVISGIIFLAIARKSTFINAVTVERTKWINQLRENIAELLEICSSINLTSGDIKSEEAQKKRQKADKLIALITLQLNPLNEIDKDMIKLLPELATKAESNIEGYRATEVKFIRCSQFLLKEEWEKVKMEAIGWLLAFLTAQKAKKDKRLADYCKWRSKNIK